METATPPAAAPQSIRFIRENECRSRTGLSRTQRWRLEREGRFPARVPLSERAFAWVESEIQDWIIARLSERAKREAVRDSARAA